MPHAITAATVDPLDSALEGLAADDVVGEVVATLLDVPVDGPGVAAAVTTNLGVVVRVGRVSPHAA